jgi:hypothetical protein
MLAACLCCCSGYGAWDLFGLLGSEPAGAADVLDSLYARYTFDNPASPQTDDSGNGLDGPLTGSTWVNDPTRGAVLSFNGAGDWMAVPSIDSLASAFSVTAWIHLRPNRPSPSRCAPGTSTRPTLGRWSG